MSFPSTIEKFSEAAGMGTISVDQPFLCHLVQIMKSDSEKQFMQVILEDSIHQKALGFFYKDLFDLFQNSTLQSRLPMNLTVIKGECSETSGGKYLIEVYFAIVEPDTYINSNLLGSFAFCEMESFLKAYINTAGEPNTNLLWGNLIHDYLSKIFSHPMILELGNNPSQLKMEIMTAFHKAVYDNWELMASLQIDPTFFFNEFKTNFLTNESDFVQQELIYYKNAYNDFEFICEKMLYSRHLGLQGKVDRLVRGKLNNQFSIYETKTGQSSQASSIFAFYQCMAYATMLKEYYPEQIDRLIIEYPRLDLRNRLVLKSYNTAELFQALKMRNEIWSHLMGQRPEKGPFNQCGKCGSRDACAFYCYRTFGTKYCAHEVDPCQYKKYFEADAEHRKIFARLNTYFSYFQRMLDQEYQTNLAIINESHIAAYDRELKGNCIADLELMTHSESFAQICPVCNSPVDNLNPKCPHCGYIFPEITFQNLAVEYFTELQFHKQKDLPIQNTRLRKGDYVLITDQNYIPLTSESSSGIIKELTENSVLVKLDRPVSSKHAFFTTKLFRIDLTTSNYMINLQRQGLDELVRFSVSTKHKNVQSLRNLLLFLDHPRIGSAPAALLAFDESTPYDESQQMAIKKALEIKDLLLIQGPPGTGKTTVIAEIVNRLIQKAKMEHPIETSNESIPENSDQLTVGKPKIRSNICPVLITAFTNKAVDNLIAKILKLNPSLNLIRIGTLASISDLSIQQYSLEEKAQIHVKYPNGTEEIVIDPNQVRHLLQNADIIATTTTTAGSVLLTNIQFETILLDEAGQIYEPSAIIPLLKGRRFILVGDHQQLPPITNGRTCSLEELDESLIEKLHFDSKRGMELSIFERLIPNCINGPGYILLTKQYRMNRIISSFISQTFYDNRLIPGEIDGRNVGDQTLRDFFEDFTLDDFNCSIENDIGKYFDPEHPMIFIDTYPLNAFDSSNQLATQQLDSFFNEIEAKIITKLMKYIFSESIRIGITYEQILSLFNHIGVISAYRAQNQKIHQELESVFKGLLEESSDAFASEKSREIVNAISIDTVDRFQGQEREIIFYSFVDSNINSDLRSLNQELRRLNVAISRAKKKVIFVGNSETLSQCTSQDSERSIKAKDVIGLLIQFIKDQNGYFLEDPIS